MATLHQARVQRLGRRGQYRPRHHPATLAAQAKARDDLRAAVAAQFGAQRRHTGPRFRAVSSMAEVATSRLYTTTWPTDTWDTTSTTSTTSWTSASWANANAWSSTSNATIRFYVQAQPDSWWTYDTYDSGSTLLTDPWRAWSRNVRTSVTASSDDAWGNWLTLRDWRHLATTAQAQADREAAANRQWEVGRRATAVAAERAEAETRAQALVCSLLSEADADRYRQDGVIDVITASGRRVQLARGWAGNAVELDPHTGRRLRRFCIHPVRDLPAGDNVASQLLMLRCDEASFFRIANATEIHDAPPAAFPLEEGARLAA